MVPLFAFQTSKPSFALGTGDLTRIKREDDLRAKIVQEEVHPSLET